MNTNDWIQKALELGFTAAYPLQPAGLRPRQDVRDQCASDRCRAYGKNWMCPPHCGTLEDCARQMQRYSCGILVQTVGKTEKRIDTKAYRRTEDQHLALFRQLVQKVRAVCPDALCLGAGGCRVCTACAYPEPCRFPEQAYASMEGYGLFVTEVCCSCGAAYHHGDFTITYTSCILFHGDSAEKIV